MDINHIHLAISDIEKSIAFYSRYFGFRHKVDHGKCVFLTNDDGFDLALDPEIEPVRFPGWFHIGSRLNSADEVRSAYIRMKEERPELIKRQINESEDFVFFRCEDPDGHEIEVYWE